MYKLLNIFVSIFAFYAGYRGRAFHKVGDISGMVFIAFVVIICFILIYYISKNE